MFAGREFPPGGTKGTDTMASKSKAKQGSAKAEKGGKGQKAEGTANLVKSVMEARGMGVRDIAKALGVAQSIITRYHQGAAEAPPNDRKAMVGLLGAAPAEAPRAAQEKTAPKGKAKATGKAPKATPVESKEFAESALAKANAASWPKVRKAKAKAAPGEARCKAPGCGKAVTSREMCNGHYVRWLRYENPETAAKWRAYRDGKRAKAAPAPRGEVVGTIRAPEPIATSARRSVRLPMAVIARLSHGAQLELFALLTEE